MARRVWFKERVFADYANGCYPDSGEEIKIRQELQTLGEDPTRGLAVPTPNPLFYQLPIPPTPYIAHYVFDDNAVEIIYLGIPGKC